MKTALYILCYFLILLYLPSDEFNNSLRAITTLIFGAYLVFVYIHTKSPLSILSFKKNFHIYIIAILFGIGAIRSNLPGSNIFGQIGKIFQLYIFIIATILATNSYIIQRKNVNNIIFNFVLLPFFLYYILNLCLYLSGISFGDKSIGNSEEAVILSYLGIHVDRVKFPLTTGLNSFAAVIGGVFTVAIINMFINHKNKVTSISFTVIFFVILLMIDSRAAIIYPFMISFILYSLNKRPHILKILPLMSILAPIFFGSILLFLSDFSFFQSLSRSSEDLSTGNSRSLIWAIALSKFATFDLSQLVGYGEFGHYTTGASLDWASAFTSYENSDLMHPHNSILAILFDYGYLGLFTYIYVLYRSISISISMWNVHKILNYLITAYIIYFVLIGITESFFGYYYLNSYYLLISFLIIQNTVYNQRALLTNTLIKKELETSIR